MAALPCFRRDVEVVPEDRGDLGPRYFVRKPETDEVYVFEEELFFVCQQLDGEVDADELCRRYTARFGRALTPELLEASMAQLRHRALLVGASMPRPTLPELLHAEHFIPHRRLRVGAGDRFFGVLAERLGWVFGTPAKLLGVAGLTLAVTVVARRWTEFAQTLAFTVNFNVTVLAFALAILILDPLRTVAHAVTAKHYGKQIRGTEVWLAYHVLPVLFVDWSDVLWERRKSRRLWMLAAGLVAQIGVLALGVAMWAVTTPFGTANQVAVITVVTAIVALVAYTANPLVEMDVCLLLAHWLEVPQMRKRALGLFGDWLSARGPREPTSSREWRWLVFYGGLCSLYVLGTYGLGFWAIGSQVASGGAGAAFVLLLSVVIFQRPLAVYAREVLPLRWYETWLARRDPATQRRLRRWAIPIVLVLLALIPYPYQTGGWLVLLPVRRTEIHAQVEGVIGQMLVREGQWVEPGQTIARIDRWEYQTQLDATRQQLLAREAEQRLLQAGPKAEEVEKALQVVRTAAEEVQRSAQVVKSAQVGSGYSSSRAQRYAQLFEEDAISRQDYDNAMREASRDREQIAVAKSQQLVAKQTLEVAKADLKLLQSAARPEQIEAITADVNRLKALVNGLEEQLRLTEIVAPVAGVVSTPYIEQMTGHYLRKGELLAAIEESKSITAELRVPEEDAGDVRANAPVTVGIWSYAGRTFTGRVLFVAPIASNETATLPDRVVRVVTELQNDDGVLKPSMTGYGKISATWRPLGVVLLWPIVRWMLVQVWYWLP